MLAVIQWAGLFSFFQSAVGQTNRPIEAFTGIPPVAYIVERVGGERVHVQAILKPGDNPHTFEPMPRQMISLDRAGLYFSIGLPFEQRLVQKLQNGPFGLRVVHAEEGILKFPLHEHPTVSYTGYESKGISGSVGDPHIWLSPPLLRIQAQNVFEGLKSTDPQSEAYYRRNLGRFMSDLDVLDHWISQKLVPFRGMAFFVFHPAFGRYADAYGLRQIAIEMEGKSPSPKQLSAFVAIAKRENISVVFVEPQFESRSASAIADAMGGEIEKLDPMERDVLGNLHIITDRVVHAFLKADHPSDWKKR
jgi:zinc transport system substrate-binding protein